jgi:hypothetical protein
VAYLAAVLAIATGVALMLALGGDAWIPLRVAGAVLLVTPACLLAWLLLPRGTSGRAERAVVTIVLVFGSLIAIGLLLDALPSGITAKGWVVASGALALAVAAVLVVRWRSRARAGSAEGTRRVDGLGERPRPTPGRHMASVRRVRLRSVATVVLAAAITTGAIAWARHGAIEMSQADNTTVLAVAPPDAAGRVAITVVSAESSSTAFRLRAFENGRLMLPVRSATLRPGAVWTVGVPIASGTSGQLTVDLYRQGKSGQLYRWVRLLLGGARAG